MTTRISRPEGFGRSSRFYECDGRHLPSVTTILNAIGKPALINWSAKVEREAVLEAARKLWKDIPNRNIMKSDVFISTLIERIGPEKQAQKLKDKAGDIGTQIHEMAEWTLRTELGQVVGEKPAINEQAEWGFMAWEDWAKKANLVPKHIEQVCWSNKHGYAGTFDLLGESNIPGRRRGEKKMVDDWDNCHGRVNVMSDWKSGKGIYPEAKLQIAAYVEAGIEMGHVERGTCGLIVRVPKVIGDPDFETCFLTADELTEYFKVFLNVFELWKYLDKQGAL